MIDIIIWAKARVILLSFSPRPKGRGNIKWRPWQSKGRKSSA